MKSLTKLGGRTMVCNSNSSGGRFQSLLRIATVRIAVAALLCSFAAYAAAQTAAAERDSILRFDPVRQELVPIGKNELKKGHVYNHYNPRLGRRVWSYVQNNGAFWHALGEGSTIEAWRFDIRGEPDELLGELTRRDPVLARRVQGRVRTVRFYLNAEDKWIEAGTSRVPSLFDVETGHRWEDHWGRYIPVRSLSGYRWTTVDGRYVPRL
jgi:hypothetical protein